MNWKGQPYKEDKQKRPGRPGHVYIMRCEDNGYYKIGMTRSNPTLRLERLQKSVPLNITLVFSSPSDDPYLLEQKLHKSFQSKRVRGEWFALKDEDVDFIKRAVSR